MKNDRENVKKVFFYTKNEWKMNEKSPNKVLPSSAAARATIFGWFERAARCATNAAPASIRTLGEMREIVRRRIDADRTDNADKTDFLGSKYGVFLNLKMKKCDILNFKKRV